MKKDLKKRLLAGVLSAVLALTIIPTTGQGVAEVNAEWQTCDVYDGSNVERQDYYVYGNTIGSYLTTCTDGKLMRVQANTDDNGKVLVEYYSSDYKLQETKTLEAELSLFGGFYETDNNYFLLTGQENPNKASSVEVYRITKYDKSWNRINSVGLFDCNTAIPFDAGSARMDALGDYLLIRTCHEMYNGHQANVTIQVNIESMAIADSYTGVMNTSVGYVSHSFNQFIKVENNHIIAVDHGDALPRSIALLQYDTDVTTGNFQTNNCRLTNVMSFPTGGVADNNYTGASIGGFEISDSSYLIAGNAIDMTNEDKFLTNETRNVFVAAVDKGNNEVNINWLTEYAEGEETTSTPHMVKIGNNQYMVLWSRDNTIYYITVDGTGKKTSETYQLAGNLSDCVPTVVNNKLVWYTWNYETIVFYDIDLNNLNKTNTKIIKNGHDFEVTSTTGTVSGNAVCKHCGQTKIVILPQSLILFWADSEMGSYSTNSPVCEYVIGTKHYLSIPSNSGVDPSNANTEIDVVISDPDVVSYTPRRTTDGSSMGYFTMLKAGTAEITIQSKWNPKAAKTYTFIVDNHLHKYVWKSTENDVATLGCEVEGCTFTKTLKVATGFYVTWGDTEGGNYSTSFTADREVGDTVYYRVSPDDYKENLAGNNCQADVIIEDPEILSLTLTPTKAANGFLTALKAGKTKITIRLKYNPEVSQTYTITVNGDIAVSSFTADKESSHQVGTSITLTAEASGGDWNYTYKFYEKDAAGKETVIREYDAAKSCIWKPDTVGTRTLYVEVKDGKGKTATKTMEYTISKSAPSADNFIFTKPSNLIYDGQSKQAAVTAASGAAGIGAITIKYYDSDGNLLTGAPTEAGTYTVKIDVAAGTSYDAVQNLTSKAWSFTITKAGDVPSKPETKINISHTLKSVGNVTLPTSWKWSQTDEGKSLEPGKTITAAAEYVGTDKENYENNTVSIAITVDTHTGGEAECSKKAVCTICNEEYGSINKNNHTGGTEIRDKKEATCMAEGYTGDTYCKGCGEVLQNGTSIAQKSHQFGEWEIVESPNCVDKGSQRRICSVCNTQETNDVDPKGHNWEENYTIDQEATCIKDGSKSIHCKDCSITKDSQTIAATGHSFINYVSDENATCTEDGTKTGVCERCNANDKVTDTGSKLGHNFAVYTSNHDATCIKDGTKTADCTRCDVKDTITDIGTKLPHSGGTATCKDKAVCDMCHTKYGELNPENHDGETELKNQKQPTCASEGYTGDTYCMGCGKLLQQGVSIQKAEHKFSDWQTVDSSSCTGGGSEQRVCESCGYTETKGVDPTKHDWETEYTIDKEPSCTEPGSRSKHCRKCDVIYDSQIMAPLGHSFTNYISDGNATCKEDGTKTAKCDRCDETNTVTDTNSKETAPHKGGEATCTELAECEVCGQKYGETNSRNHTGEIEIRNAKEATCQEQGYEGDKYCKDCNNLVEKGAFTDKLEHKYEDGKCLVCGVLEDIQNEGNQLEIIFEMTDDVYMIGTDAQAVVKCSGKLSELINVKMDGEIVDPSNYSLEEGSTIVIFHKAYMDTLTVGAHTVELDYISGSVQTTISVKSTDSKEEQPENNTGNEENSTENGDSIGSTESSQKETDSGVKTGDVSKIGLYILLISAASVLIFGVKHKKISKVK